MHLNLPKIYGITDVRISGLSHIEQVERLLEGGVQLIQLREKHASAREFYEAAKAVMEFTKGREASIVINDRVDIAAAVAADGVHLGQSDLSPVLARKILGPGRIIGYSTHSLGQVIEATRLPIDYVAFGPIYSTTTKAMPEPIVGAAIINEVKPFTSDLPLVVIGGIDSGNIREVFDAGADSAAIIGGLISDKTTIPDRARKLISLANSGTTCVIQG